jgi:hypothetical protein
MTVLLHVDNFAGQPMVFAHLTGRKPVKIRNGRATVIGDVDWYQP